MILDAFFGDSAATDGITIRVAPNFLEAQSQVDARRWFWSYHVRIESRRAAPVQLLTRHWKITDAAGVVNYVDGDGVVGEQPVIEPGGAHDYVSGCPLPTSSGHMEGHFRFISADGSTFLAEIPRFELRAPIVVR